MKKVLFILLAIFTLFSCQNNPKSTNQASANDNASTANTDAKATTSDAAKLDKSTTKNLEGIDISHYQVNIDWDKVKTDNVNFVFVKSTGGETYIDPSFRKHWASVENAGLIRGAYHFYYTKDDPTKQANFFVSTVLPLSKKSDLPPVIDIETDGINSDVTPEQLQKDVQTFLSIVQAKFDRKPILYTSYDFAQKYLNNPLFDNYYLWIAEYDSKSPVIPNAWTKSGWTFWQNTPSATVSGIEGDVDHDYFNGGLEAIKSL